MKIRVDLPVTPQLQDMPISDLKAGNTFRSNGTHYILTSEPKGLNEVYAVKLTNGKMIGFSIDDVVTKRSDLMLAKAG